MRCIWLLCYLCRPGQCISSTIAFRLPADQCQSSSQSSAASRIMSASVIHGLKTCHYNVKAISSYPPLQILSFHAFCPEMVPVFEVCIMNISNNFSLKKLSQHAIVLDHWTMFSFPDISKWSLQTKRFWFVRHDFFTFCVRLWWYLLTVTVTAMVM